MADAPLSTVLLVDDDPQIRQLYSLILEDEYTVRVADSGETALEAFTDDVDVALLDRRMSGLSGGEVLDRLREQGFDQPIAMVTAVEPDFDVLEMGFDGYVVKPVSAEELCDVVESLLLRKEYDDVIREYFALVSKCSVLEDEQSPAALESSEAYAQCAERVDEIKDEARAALEAAIDAGKFDELMVESHGYRANPTGLDRE